MGAFVVKILLFLLFVGLKAPDVVDGSRPMHMKNKNSKGDHEHSSETSSYKDFDQDDTVIGKDDHEHSSKNSTYKDYNQDDKEVRAVVPQMVFNNPQQQCYTQFFAGGLQPAGLRTGQNNLQNIRYICQMVNQQTYYGTMFDEGLGIAVFSAYTLTPANVNFQNRRRRSWRRTPGIWRQGSNGIYRYQPYHRGHLVPQETYSNTPDSLRSTFVYTNAVPQRPAFNTGQWAQFERRIRVYATQQCTQGLQPGTLYLLTGTAFGHIQNNPPGFNPQVQVNQLGPAGNNPAIDIPNSMWTAGCCVRPNGNVQSFAVIGNNLQNTNQILTQQIPVARLQNILAADVVIGGPNVNLFQGNGACSNINNNLPNLPPGNGR